MAMNPNIPNEITRQLDNVNFPVSKDELVNKVGTQNVNVGGRDLKMRDIFQKVNKDRFNSKDELLNELKNVPEIKEGGGQTGGTVGQTGGGKR